MNSVKSNNLTLKYKRFTPSGCKDIGIIISEFVVKTHYHSTFILHDHNSIKENTIFFSFVLELNKPRKQLL